MDRETVRRPRVYFHRPKNRLAAQGTTTTPTTASVCLRDQRQHLNREELAQARVLLPRALWRTPSEFAFIFHLRRDLALRYAEGSAPAPVATTAQQGNPPEDVSKPADCHRCLDSTGPKAHQIARPRL